MGNMQLQLGHVFLGWSFFCWFCCCLILPVNASGEESKDVPTGDSFQADIPSSAQIHRWARELDDDHYAVREAAQQQLVAARRLALEAVSALAASQTTSLESITRAVRILTTWSESKDSGLRLSSLERLAGLTNRPMEAALAKEVLATLYERNAIEEIERLGGRCELADPRHKNARLPKHYKKRLPLRVTLGVQWKGTDDDLKGIAQIRRTTIVSLHSASVGDRALGHLTKLPALLKVEIYGMQLSDEAIAEFQKQLPDVKIDIRVGGAKLGIRGDPAPKVKARVVDVQLGSAAHRAGLAKQDIITHVAGIPIDSFAALTQQIATYQPGDTVELTINRKNQTMLKKVTFDRWGAVERKTPSPDDQERN